MTVHRGEAGSTGEGGGDRAAVCYDCELIAATFSFGLRQLMKWSVQDVAEAISEWGMWNGEWGRAIKSKRVSCQASSRGGRQQLK